MCVFVCHLHPATENTAHEIKLEGKLRTTDKSKNSMGKKKMAEEVRWWCRCWREWKRVSDRFTKEMEGGVVGRVMCCKVWASTAPWLPGCNYYRMVSDWWFEPAGLQKHLSAVGEAAAKMRSPSHVELNWAALPSSMIHEQWRSLLTRAGLQPKLSSRTQNNCPLHNKWAKEAKGNHHHLLPLSFSHFKACIQVQRIRSCYQRTHQQEEGKKTTAHWSS